ncbi:MAG: ribonuclease HII [Alphaproteobacteria bacterium]|jgi:ribonuclease HII|nr:ribonuclease HII [Alphaproteobacteria bacterium]MBU2042948.1 ribonuclease HII [Alphaproteobacteria bacterium]MBU2165447.1 ribonuclease HII [Alphaproteobacteria bacterium]MBU2208917.1 ribonuclease HII [Alphaproteobacteria bacterium]MBU2292330.1 ribonuclease HII [Alphaproteobacteria bacterium]
MLSSPAGSCDGPDVKTPTKSPAKAKLSRAFPTLALEILLIESAGGPVCGVDEAGRGPWAGPVSAGAVILNPDDLPAGIDDSKALTHARREALEIEIKARAVAWGVGFASVEEIETHNILNATGLAMCRAIEALSVQPVAALVDGNYGFRLPCAVQTVIKGDSLSLSIAAASILAKTARDRLMVALDVEYPGYGFAGHKGYNAPIHSAALKALGPCPAHRRSWAPIRALLDS